MIVDGRVYESTKAYFDWALQTYVVSTTERTLLRKPRSKKYPYGVDTHKLLITVSADTPIMAKYIKEGYSSNRIVREIDEAAESIIMTVRGDLHPEWIRLVQDSSVGRKAYATLEEALLDLGVDNVDELSAEVRYSPRKK